jgi:hypothetical protein
LLARSLSTSTSTLCRRLPSLLACLLLCSAPRAVYVVHSASLFGLRASRRLALLYTATANAGVYCFRATRPKPPKSHICRHICHNAKEKRKRANKDQRGAARRRPTPTRARPPALAGASESRSRSSERGRMAHGAEKKGIKRPKKSLGSRLPVHTSTQGGSEAPLTPSSLPTCQMVVEAGCQ